MMGSLINQTFIDELAKKNSDELARNKLQAEMQKKTAEFEHNRELVFLYLQRHFPFIKICNCDVNKLAPKEFSRILRLAKRRERLYKVLCATRTSFYFIPLIMCILLIIFSFTNFNINHPGWAFIFLISGIIGIIPSSYLI